MTASDAPLIGIPASTGIAPNAHTLTHRVSDKYIEAAIELSGCLPLMIPAIGDRIDISRLTARFDGILLTGGRANVEPHQYDGPPSIEGTVHDPARDQTTLPLLREAVATGVPVLAICLGIQELNVALGGSLHQRVHELDGREDHRLRRDLSYDERYDDRHMIRLHPDGVLARLMGGAEEVMVNSLHAQGIDRPGDGVLVEAISEDGVIESISVPDAPAFTLGVQWHPEHHTIRRNPINKAIFEAFGEAIEARRRQRQAGGIGDRAA